MELSDTHCHLDFKDFSGDLDEVLDRAREAGVARFLLPGIDVISSRQVIAIAEAHEDVFAAVGIHPNQLESWSESTVAELVELAQEACVVAVGEIGLDHYRMRSDPAEQAARFWDQLEMAADLNLPVVVHNRDATGPVIKMLSDWHSDLVEFGSELAERAGVLHSYSDTSETAATAKDLSLSIGITGPVTFKNADGLREVVGKLPLEQLLIETDSPFLSPEPNRGKRNEPARVRDVAIRIAEVRRTTLDVISEKTSENAKRLFRW